MLVVLLMEILELKCIYFIVNKIMHCPFHEGISKANKPLAQNNQSSFTQVLTRTQVTTDMPKSGPFFLHEVWMKKTTFLCHFSLGPPLPVVLLIPLQRWKLKDLHKTHRNELCQCNHWKEEANWILPLGEFSTVIWYLYFLKSRSPLFLKQVCWALY